MKRYTEDNSRPTANASHSSRKYAKHRAALASAAWLLLLAATVVVFRAIPSEVGRDLLPAAVYLTMSVLPFALVALTPRAAPLMAAVVLSAISIPVLLSGSGLAGGGDILLIVALPSTAGCAAFGLLVGRLSGRHIVPTTFAASAIFLIPLVLYWLDPHTPAALALPGSGPLGLTAMLLGRPPTWASFGPAWISTGVYSGAGIISGLATAAATKWPSMRTGSH